jgi:tetratricopeptide (TPR) repeat protein
MAYQRHSAISSHSAGASIGLFVALLTGMGIPAPAHAQTSKPSESWQAHKSHADFLRLAQQYPIAPRFLLSSDGKPLNDEQNKRIVMAERFLAEADDFRQKGDYVAAREKAEDAMQICRSVLGPAQYLSITATGARRLYGAYADQPPENQAALKQTDAIAWEAKRLYYTGDYPVAEVAARRAIEQRELIFGKQYNELMDVDSISLLALIQTQRRKFKDAEETINHAIQILERSFGNDHPKMAIALGRKGWLQFSSGKADKSLETLRHAALIMNRTAGETLDTARILDYLGTACTINQDYEGAIYRKVRSLVIREKLAGKDAVETGESLSNLAWLYGYIGMSNEKMPLRQRALEIFTKRLGPNHPFTLMELSNIAHLYESQRNFDEAIHIYEKYLGKNAELPILNELKWSPSLASVYLQANRPKDAERVIKMVLDEAGKAQSAQERKIAGYNLAEGLRGLLMHHLFDQAEKFLADSAKILPGDDVELARPADLMTLYAGVGRYEDLVKIAGEQIELKKKDADVSLPLLASLHYARTEAFLALNQLDSAEVECQEALGIIENSIGNRSLSHADALSLMGRVHTKKKRLNDAKFDFVDAEKIFADVKDSDSVFYLNYLLARSDLEVAQNQLDAAKATLREAVEKLRKMTTNTPGMDSTTQLLAALKRYYDVLKSSPSDQLPIVESQLKALYKEMRDAQALNVESKAWATDLGM